MASSVRRKIVRNPTLREPTVFFLRFSPSSKVSLSQDPSLCGVASGSEKKGN